MTRKSTAKRNPKKDAGTIVTAGWEKRMKRPLLKKRPSAGWPKARNEQHKDMN